MMTTKTSRKKQVYCYNTSISLSSTNNPQINSQSIQRKDNFLSFSLLIDEIDCGVCCCCLGSFLLFINFISSIIEEIELSERRNGPQPATQPSNKFHSLSFIPFVWLVCSPAARLSSSLASCLWRSALITNPKNNPIELLSFSPREAQQNKRKSKLISSIFHFFFICSVLLGRASPQSTKSINSSH